MRSTLIALLGCMLLVGVCVAPAMAAEKSESSGALLAVRSLDVTPLTDEQLDQVVGTANIFLAIALDTVQFGPFAVALDASVVLNLDNGAFEAIDLLASVGPITLGVQLPVPAP
jgi:hypothetical protein